MDHLRQVTGMLSSRLGGPALLLGARYASAVIGPVVSLLVVRYLGPELYGFYASAAAVTELFGLISDLGLQQAALETSARGMYPIPAILRNMVRLGTSYSFAGFVASAAWTILGRYQSITLVLVLYLGLGFFQRPLLSAVTVGLQHGGKYGRIALWNLAVTSARWVGFLIAIIAHAGLRGVIAWPLFLSWITIGIMLVAERQRFQWSPAYRSDGTQGVLLRQLAVRSWRFGSSSVLHQLYHRSDSVLLSLMRDPIEVGHYAVAFKMVQLLTTLPGIVFNQVLYPKYFKWFKSDPAKVVTYYHMTSKWMLAAGGVAASWMALNAVDLIELVFGSAQATAAALLTVMTWSVPMRFVGASAGALLTTGNQIDRKIKIQAVLAAVSIALNAVLIPRYGAVAPASMLVATDTALLVSFALVVRRTQGARLWDSSWGWVSAALLLTTCATVYGLAHGWTLGFRILGGILLAALGGGYLWLTLNGEERRELKHLARGAQSFEAAGRASE